MKTPLIAIAIAAALCGTASARLRESVAECKARYGEPVKIDESHSAIVFSKGGFNIVAFFDKGRATALDIIRPQPGAVILNEKITDEQIQTILKSNGGGSEWEVMPGMPIGQKCWKTKDGKAYAFYDMIEHRLNLVTGEQFDKMIKAHEAEKKKEVEGF